MTIPALLRQPALWFLVAGGVLFGGHAVVAPDADHAPTIRVDDSVVDALREDFILREGREPDAVELDGAVASYVRSEALTREAIEMGLHEADPVVRRRLVQAMEFLLEDAAVAEPGDDELQAWFDAHRDAFGRPGATGFYQVFVRGTDDAASERAGALRASLDAGTAAQGLGDPFPDGTQIGPLPTARIGAMFGEGFARTLDACEPRVWCGPISSDFGWHIVRVSERRAAIEPAFEDVRHEVRDAWLQAHATERREAAVDEIVDRYEIIR